MNNHNVWSGRGDAQFPEHSSVWRSFCRGGCYQKHCVLRGTCNLVRDQSWHCPVSSASLWGVVGRDTAEVQKGRDMVTSMISLVLTIISLERMQTAVLGALGKMDSMLRSWFKSIFC